MIRVVDVDAVITGIAGRVGVTVVLTGIWGHRTIVNCIRNAIPVGIALFAYIAAFGINRIRRRRAIGIRVGLVIVIGIPAVVTSISNIVAVGIRLAWIIGGGAVVGWIRHTILILIGKMLQREVIDIATVQWVALIAYVITVSVRTILAWA